jgi:hypothetical protein
MFPQNIGIPPKRKYSIVNLWKIKLAILPIIIRLSSKKGKFASGSKACSDGDVLRFSALGIKGCRVMMKGFPVTTISVPIESSANVFGRVNTKVLTETCHYSFIGGTSLRVFGDEVGSFMPTDPFGASTTPFPSTATTTTTISVILFFLRRFLFSLLQFVHLLHHTIVQIPILLFAKQIRNNHYIIML